MLLVAIQTDVIDNIIVKGASELSKYLLAKSAIVGIRPVVLHVSTITEEDAKILEATFRSLL